jgi:hypothetical protein
MLVGGGAVGGGFGGFLEVVGGEPVGAGAGEMIEECPGAAGDAAQEAARTALSGLPRGGG